MSTITVNTASEAEFAASVATDLFGPERFGWIDNPGAGSEDFSYVLNEVPGCYLNLGACPDTDPDGAPNNHSPYARYDDSVVADGALLLAELAWRRLQSS